MARKKIVFVIVEGPSDAEALDTIIERLLDKDTVHVHIVHGDLTTENGVTSSNIINRVVDEVRSYTASNPFTKNDFKELLCFTTALFWCKLVEYILGKVVL